VLSLGANLGNRLETLQGAIDALEDTPGVRIKAVSPVYETEPWGVEPGSQPSYFNAVVVLKTTLPPSSLLERAHAVEEAFHRVRDERWGARTLDVDIVAYADVIDDDPHLTLPHPRAHERAFVLAPWHDMEPEAQLPGRGAVAALLDSVTREGVTARKDLELHLPE
jgi:2-amino-4-hydroxy-6-hydroxymethyldihydropteridine diphosphokinase